MGPRLDVPENHAAVHAAHCDLGDFLPWGGERVHVDDGALVLGVAVGGPPGGGGPFPPFGLSLCAEHVPRGAETALLLLHNLLLPFTTFV